MNLQDKINLVEEALYHLKHIKHFDLENKGARKALAQHIVNYIEINKSNGKG